MIRPFIFITAHHGLFFVFVITAFVTRSIFALKVMICCFHCIQTYTYVIYHHVCCSINRAAARERERRLAANAGEDAAADVQAVAQV